MTHRIFNYDGPNNIYEIQLLYDLYTEFGGPDSGLFIKGNRMFSIIPEIYKGTSIKKYNIDDFKMLGLPKEIYFAPYPKNGKKTMIKQIEQVKDKDLAKLLAIGHFPDRAGLDGLVNLLKSPLRRKRIDFLINNCFTGEDYCNYADYLLDITDYSVHIREDLIGIQAFPVNLIKD
jgi:hypothetical protein